MKRYIFLISLILNIKAFALTAEDTCQMLRNELSNAMKTANLNSQFLSERNIGKCFSAKMLVTNDYSGGFHDFYDLFMDNLNDATTDILQIMTIADQVDASLSHVNGSLEESKHLVNSINVWQFIAFGEKFHVVVSGFGDDDYYLTTLFKSNKTEILLMSAEID